MANQKRTQMDKICGNCGNTQPTEQLVTCQMCRKASEHIYCMRNQLYEVPASWYCEECEEKASGLQNASKRQKTSVGSYSNIEKDKRFKQTPPQDVSGRDVPKKRLIKAWSDSPGLITTGNQKPICSQDVSKKTPNSYKVTAISGSSNKPASRPLSNGTSYKEAKISKTILLEEVTPLRHRVRSGAHRLSDVSFHQNVQKSVLSTNKGRARANESPATNSRSTQVLSEPNRESVGADRRSSLLTRVTSGKNIGGDKIEMTQKTKGLGMSTGRAPAKDFVASNSRSAQVLSERNRGSVGVDRPSSLLTCVTRGKNISGDKVETTQKIKDLGSPASCSPAKVMRSDFQEENLPLVLAIDPDGKFLTGPASQVCWKGTFEVIDVINIQYSEIRAYFPRMVCSKVYEIRRCLPEKLKFTLLPMRDVWPQIFRAEPPTKDDVGLYFFPCEEERHKEKYARFIERIESRSLAMQTCVNNVHLLLFTSKQLPLNSQDINGEIYLWGIFRNAKSKKRNQDNVRQSHTEHVKNKCVQKNVSCKEIAEEVDMEIDMVGGNEIGRIDVPIKKASWLYGFGEPNARDLNYVGTAPLKVTDPIHSDVPPVISELGPPVLPKLPNSELQSSSCEATPKLTSPMHPDALPVVSVLGPSALPKLPNSELQSRPYEATPKLRSPMYPDVPPVFVKSEPSGCPNVPTPRQQSLHGVTSKVVENPIRPDIPPGFGKTEPHKCPKLLTSKRQSSAEPSSMEVKDHIHLDVPPCFVKLEPSGCPNVPIPKQQSLHGATSKEARSPLYPDIPPGFGKLEPQKCPKLLTPKHQSSPEGSSKEMGGHIRLDVPPGSAKLEPSGCPNALTPEQQSSHGATSKEVGSPINPDIPPGFGKRETHKCPKLLTPRKQSLPVASSKEVGGHIHLDVPLGSVKLEPSGCPNTLTPKQQSLHRATFREVGSPIHPDIPPGFRESEPHKYPKLITHKQKILPEVPKEVGGHIHLDVPPDSVKLEPSECLNAPTPEQQGLHRATSKEVGNPILPDIPPGFGKLELHKCPKLLTHKQPSSSEASSKEVGGHIQPDVSPGFAEVEPPGFAQLRSSKQESLSRTTSKEAVSQIHPNVPPGFAELRSPGSLNVWAPKHKTSSSVDTSKATVSSRMNSRGKLAARNVRDWVATSPESHEIQSKHHQVSDLGDKSAKHLGSSKPTHSTATNVLKDAVQKRIISSDNSSPGIEKKMTGSTEPVSKKQQSSALSVCETESGTPRPKASDTSKGQNEKGREKEVSVSECSSKECMEEIECIHEILDLNFVSNLASEVSTASDTQSSTIQPPLGTFHTVSVDNSLAERIARMKKLCNLVPDKKRPDLITLSSDTESGVLLTDHYAKEEDDVSECTSTEAKDARRERVLSPMTPALQLFPDAVESVRANEAELCVNGSVGLVSAEMSLSIPQYVRDGNNWIPKSVKERLKRDGCGKELRLSL